MPRTATPTVTDLSVDTLRKYALSNKSFVAAINKRRKALTAQIEEIDGILSGEGIAPAPKKRGRPAKGKTSLKAAVLEIIRSNGGRVDVADIMGHLKKMGFDTSAKTIHPLQHRQEAESNALRIGMSGGGFSGYATGRSLDELNVLV